MGVSGEAMDTGLEGALGANGAASVGESGKRSRPDSPETPAPDGVKRRRRARAPSSGPVDDSNFDPQPEPTPSCRFSDVAGCSQAIDTLTQVALWPLLHPRLFEAMGVVPPVGILLHGPPGCGKTLLANAAAGELCSRGVSFLRASAPALIAGMSGESEVKQIDRSCVPINFRG